MHIFYILEKLQLYEHHVAIKRTMNLNQLRKSIKHLDVYAVGRTILNSRLNISLEILLKVRCTIPLRFSMDILHYVLILIAMVSSTSDVHLSCVAQSVCLSSM